MSTKLSLATMNGGGIIEAVDMALQRIADNISDINTPPDKLRELSLKIKFRPDKNRALGTAESVVSVKLQPEEPQTVSLILDKDADGIPTIYEAYSDHSADQYRFEGTMPADQRERDVTTPNVTPFRTAAQ